MKRMKASNRPKPAYYMLVQTGVWEREREREREGQGHIHMELAILVACFISSPSHIHDAKM